MDSIKQPKRGLGLFSRRFRIEQAERTGFKGRSAWMAPPNVYDKNHDPDQKVLNECSEGLYTGLCCP